MKNGKSKKRPALEKRGAKAWQPHYSIKSKRVRSFMRNLPEQFRPVDGRSEAMAEEMLDGIRKAVNDYARKIAKRAVNRIGRDLYEYDPLKACGKHTRRGMVADASKLDELQDFCDEQNKKIQEEYADRMGRFSGGGW